MAPRPQPRRQISRHDCSDFTGLLPSEDLEAHYEGGGPSSRNNQRNDTEDTDTTFYSASSHAQLPQPAGRMAGHAEHLSRNPSTGRSEQAMSSSGQQARGTSGGLKRRASGFGPEDRGPKNARLQKTFKQEPQDPDSFGNQRCNGFLPGQQDLVVISDDDDEDVQYQGQSVRANGRLDPRTYSNMGAPPRRSGHQPSRVGSSLPSSQRLSFDENAARSTNSAPHNTHSEMLSRFLNDIPTKGAAADTSGPAPPRRRRPSNVRDGVQAELQLKRNANAQQDQHGRSKGVQSKVQTERTSGANMNSSLRPNPAKTQTAPRPPLGNSLFAAGSQKQPKVNIPFQEDDSDGSDDNGHRNNNRIGFYEGSVRGGASDMFVSETRSSSINPKPKAQDQRIPDLSSAQQQLSRGPGNGVIRMNTGTNGAQLLPNPGEKTTVEPPRRAVHLDPLNPTAAVPVSTPHIARVESQADRSTNIGRLPGPAEMTQVMEAVAEGVADNRQNTKNPFQTSAIEDLQIPDASVEVDVSTLPVVEQPQLGTRPPAPMLSHGAPAAPMMSGPSVPAPVSGFYGGTLLHNNVPERIDGYTTRSDKSFASQPTESLRERQQRNAQMAREIAREQQDRLSDTHSMRDDNYNNEIASYSKSEKLRRQHLATRQETVLRQRHRVEDDMANGRSPSAGRFDIAPHLLPCAMNDADIDDEDAAADKDAAWQADIDGQGTFSAETVASFVIGDIDRAICRWKDMGMPWKDIKNLADKKDGSAHSIAELKARHKLTRLKEESGKETAGERRVNKVQDQVIPLEQSDFHLGPVISPSTPKAQTDRGFLRMPGSAQSRRIHHSPSERVRQQQRDIEMQAQRLAELGKVEQEKRRMAEELEMERQRRQEAEAKAAEQVRLAKEKAEEEEKSRKTEEKKRREEEKRIKKAEQEERKKQNDLRILQNGKKRSAKVGKASALGFSFPRGDDFEYASDTGAASPPPPSRKTKSSLAAAVVQPNSDGGEGSTEDTPRQTPTSARSKAPPKRASNPKKPQQQQRESQKELNARGFATQSGKTVLSIKTLDAWMDKTSDDGITGASDEDMPADRPEEILEDDLTYHMYVVKRKSWTEDEEPSDDDEMDLVLTLGEYASRSAANAAAADELLRYSAGDAELVIDPSKPYSIHHEPQSNQLALLRADLPKGHLKVWVVADLRSRYQGPLPRFERADFVNKQVFVVKQATKTVSSEENGGEMDEEAEGDVKEVGDIYSTLTLANSTAADRLVELTFHTNARRIDEVNSQRTEARWEFDALLDGLEQREEKFCMERENWSGQMVKVWVEVRKLSGPRN